MSCLEPHPEGSSFRHTWPRELHHSVERHVYVTSLGSNGWQNGRTPAPTLTYLNGDQTSKPTTTPGLQTVHSKVTAEHRSWALRAAHPGLAVAVSRNTRSWVARGASADLCREPQRHAKPAGPTLPSTCLCQEPQAGDRSRLAPGREP